MKKHKIIRFSMILAFLLVQITLLFVTIKEHFEMNNFAIIAIVVVNALVLFLGFRYMDLHHDDYGYEKLSVALWVPVGAMICYILNIYGELGSVVAAGITGTVASFIPSINKKSSYFEKLPAAIYCGAFVGMSSLEIAPSIYFILLAGILAGMFYLISKNLFLGVGGKLGTIAFGGVIIISLFYWLAL